MNNLAALIEAGARKFPDKKAVTFGENHLTYGILKDSVDRLAMGLRELGLCEGDRVGLMLPNIPHFPIAFYAMLQLGITIVPVSIMLMPQEIRHQLEDSEAKGILYWEGFRSKVKPAVTGLEHCRKLLVLGERAGQDEIRVNYLMEKCQPLQEIADVEPDRTAVIVYTAGMTGTPKGAELTHLNIRSNVESIAAHFKFTHDETVLAVLPFTHTIGQTLVMGCFLNACGRLVLMPRFDAARALDLLEKEKCTYFVGVPSMFQEMLQVQDAGPGKTKTLKYCLSSGDAIRQEVFEEFESHYKVNILEGYGLTEASPMVSFNSPVRDRWPGSIGLPLPGVEMKILDESGEEVNPGRVGEIVVQGPNVMKGYLNRPEATKEALKDGWLQTGDLAMLHEDGYASVVVRKKNVIVKSGFNVYPMEVEKLIAGHPKVSGVVVVGMPDPAVGQEIHACVIIRDGESLSEKEVIAYTKERIAAYKCPRKVHFYPSLPLGPNGRVLRDKVVHMLMDRSK